VNPEIFDVVNNAGSVENLLTAENMLTDKCIKLNDINPGQYFLPTTLRS
jgi:hypothetical protein